MKTITEAAKKAEIEAKWWKWAAWTAPFVALAALAFEYAIGWNTAFTKTLVIICVVFFSVSVYWWWWALSKIVTLLDSFQKTEEHFNDVKYELKETRKAIRGE